MYLYRINPKFGGLRFIQCPILESASIQCQLNMN